MINHFVVDNKMVRVDFMVKRRYHILKYKSQYFPISVLEQGSIQYFNSLSLYFFNVFVNNMLLIFEPVCNKKSYSFASTAP